MKTLFFAFLFLVGVGFVGCNRNKEKIVAEVNGERIASTEFKKRYEQFLAQGSKRDNILLRQEILNNMINERLIFRDVTRQGFDRDEAYRKRIEGATTQALLDRYALKISFDTIKITQHELLDEFRFYNTTASAHYLYAKDEQGARALKQQVDRGETFDALAKGVFQDPGLANNGGYLGAFGWGDMEPALEEAAFTLPLGWVSDPIKLSIGYAIVKVETRVHQPLVSESDYFKVRQKLADKIQEKKINRLVRSAADEASKSLSATFYEAAVNQVFSNWNLIAERMQMNVEAKDVVSQNISSMKLMEFSNGSWTVGDFLQKVEWTTEKQKRRVQNVDEVKQMALGLATRDVLVERAKSMGLESDSTVKAQIENVRERYLLRHWADSVLDTIGNFGWDQRLLDSMYVANKTQYSYPPTVNVGEILVRTESEANVLLNKLKRGAHFAVLAQENSIRLWAAKRGGELGFGTQATFGPMGEKFSNATVNEIIGPEKVDPYWGIFKILGRKEGRQKSFDEARDDVIQGLLPFRKQEVSRNAVANMRSRAGISINNEILANVVIQSDNQAKR